MKEEDKLIEKFGRDPGFRIPDGYFDQIISQTMEKLGPAELPSMSEEKISMWHRVRPYLYMAAMFAGIWLMMKVFYTVTPMSELSLDNPPEHIAMVMQDNTISDPLLMEPAISDYELERELSEQYSTIEEFEEAFESQADEDSHLSEEVEFFHPDEEIR